MNNKQRIVIGLTGQLAAGKGAVSDFFVNENGFSYFSLSHRVRELAASKGIENATRKILQDTGDTARQNFGGDIFARLTAGLAFLSNSDRIIIDGIRNPAEVEFFMKSPDFKLCAVTADREKRFERMLARARSSDPTTYEQFLIADSRDFCDPENLLGQQVGKCIEMAHMMLKNDGTLEELIQATNLFAKTLKLVRTA